MGKAAKASREGGDAELEQRILRRFSSMARAEGPSAVVMAGLARDLGISTKTVYRVFPSKAELVHRLMEQWASRLEQQLQREAGDEHGGPFVDQLLKTSEVWQQHRRRFGSPFWEELERDYPDSYALVAEARQRLRHHRLEQLRPLVRTGISPELALDLFDAALARAMDPTTHRRFGVDAHAAVRTAVQVWAGGALSEPLPSRPPRRRRPHR